MSSSTSSSNWRFRVVVMVVGVLVLVEVGARVTEPWISLDVRHIAEIPQIVDELDRAVGRQILFFGNSLTRRGVDLDVIADVLGPEVVPRDGVAAFYPDDTTMLDWLYLYEHVVSRPNHDPDVVILGFALTHLEDTSLRAAQTYRLGRHFTSWASLPDLFEQDITRGDDRIDIVVSKLSRAYANRDRISRRVLDLLPSYRASADWINDRRERRAGSDGGPYRPTYRRLDRFVQHAKQRGTTVILVAMPLRAPYALDPGFQQYVEDFKITFIDAREVPGLNVTHYLDSMHLGPEGARIFSAYLGWRLTDAGVMSWAAPSASSMTTLGPPNAPSDTRVRAWSRWPELPAAVADDGAHPGGPPRRADEDRTLQRE
jgi:hypothetical protein